MGFVIGVLNEIIRKKNRKRIVKNVEIENNNSKGVIEYKPSDLEAFFEPEDFEFGNILASGYSSHKDKLVLTSIYHSQSYGYKTVVLHCGNINLEQEIANYVANPLIINGRSRNYDPFIGQSNQDIYRMIKNSSDKLINFSSEAKYYVDGICNFIRSKGIAPYINMLISCPHDLLLDKVDIAERNNKISSNTADSIRRSILQGQTQRFNVETYFDELNHQCGGSFATSLNIKQSSSISGGVVGHDVVIFDINNPSNELSFNLVCEDLMNAITSNKKLNIILYNMPLGSNKRLENIIKSKNSNTKFTLVCDDFYGSIFGENSEFSAICSSCSQIYIFRHSNGLSCDAISKLFGTYEEQKISANYTSSNNYQEFGTLLPGKVDQQGLNISKNTAQIVPSRQIQTMKENEFYLISIRNGTISHTKIR